MMFPPILSEGIFALSGSEPKRALSFVADVDASGRLVSYDVVPSTVMPTSMHYDDADLLLSGSSPSSAQSPAAVAVLKVR